MGLGHASPPLNFYGSAVEIWGVLCHYSEALGVPGQGIHSYRLADIAVVDVILTLIAAYGVGLFCVRTTVDKLIFDYLYIETL